MQWDSVLSWISVAGAIGTAAMGLVEALKVVTLPGGWSLATIGLGKVRRHLGVHAIRGLERVYGPGSGHQLLEGAWRKGPEELDQTLRNGLRMAIFANLPNLGPFIEAFGQSGEEISEAVTRLRQGENAPSGAKDPAVARERVARLEAAIDARVRAAVAAGRDAYVSMMQLLASLVAVGGSVLVVYSKALPESISKNLTSSEAILVGLLSVPIAPVSKDIVAFLNSIRTSFETRGVKH